MKNPIRHFLLLAFFSIMSVLLLTSCQRNLKVTNESNNQKEEEEKEERESGADGQLSAWFQAKGYPDASNLTGKYQTAWAEYQEIKKNQPQQGYLESMGNWTHVGPKAYGGRILCLAINPLANAAGQRTIFCGSAGGGIWKTYNSGIGASAWSRVVTGFPVLGAAAMAYHPTDTNIILAGTGEVYRMENYSSTPYSSDQVSNIGRNAWKARGTYGVGILRSNNAGNTWSQVLIKSNSDLFGIQKIKFHPTNPDTVYACATDGLYRSPDRGATWSRIWTGTYCSDVVINPSNITQIVIAAGNVTNNPKGIWRSNNSGASFAQITGTGFPTPSQYKGFTNFTILGTNTIIASVGVGDNDNNGTYDENEVYRSNDFGATWASVSNSNHAKWQSWFSHGVTAFPGTTDKVFMFGVKKFTLTMSGGSGTTGSSTGIALGSAATGYLVDGSQEGSNTYVHDDVHDVQFVPGSTTVAYWATDGGVFRTANATSASITFASCNGGLYAQQFYPTIAQSQINANIIYGGLQDNGVIRYNGTGWQKVQGGDGATCSFKPDDENVVLISSDTRGVNRYVISPASSSSVMSYLGNIPNGYDNRTAFCSPVVPAPLSASSTRWYVGSDNFHVSTNGGASFSGNGTPPGTAYIDALHKPAIAIGVSYSNADVAYVSVSPFSQNLLTDGLYYTPPARVRKTTNGGSSFTTMSGGLPDRVVSDFAVSPTNQDSVFATLGGFGTAHVYVTGDGGVNWSPRSSGLPDVPFNTILIDPANPQILYAGSDFGVHVSPDRGANWYDFSNGFWDATYVMDLTFAPGGKVRVATHGKGIFEADKWNGFVTLPVTMVSFTGVNEGTKNKLVWVTEQESNLVSYELQRSTDGLHYQTIQTQVPQNNSNRTTYQAFDYIGNNPAPRYFYRIKSVNQDHSYQFSEIVMIKISDKAKYEILGNPFAQSLTLRYTMTQTNKVLASIWDMQGRMMQQQEFSASAGTGTYTFNNLINLPAGTYLLTLDMNSDRTTIKVIKK